MGRDITIRFLDADRKRAEVVVIYTPGWAARWFGLRARKQTAIAVFGAYQPYPRDVSLLTDHGWLYAADRTFITDIGITHALVQARRWVTTDVTKLQAPVVTPTTKDSR